MEDARQAACGSCGRYGGTIEPCQEDGLEAAYHAAVLRALDRLGRQPGRPRALEPFESLFRDGWRVEELERGDRPVVGILCNFVPEELVVAAGAVPLRLDLGQQQAMEVGARRLPVDVCPEIKSVVGAHVAGMPLYRLAKLLVVPTSCDGRKKLAGLLGGRRVVPLELPQGKRDRRVRALWVERIRELVREVEGLTGRKLKRGPLRAAVALTNRRSALVRRLNALRWKDPHALSGRDTFLVLQASFLADVAWWVQKTEALLAELEARSAPSGGGAEPTRVLLTGSPIYFPDFQLLHVVEEAGAVVIADELCSGTERLYHPTVTDEGTVDGLVRAAAERTLLPCTCPCFVSSDDRIARLLELARQSGARGLVHHTLHLCQLYDLELPTVAAALKGAALPLLNVYTEYSEEDSGVLQNRVEAFLEMLAQ